MPNTKESGIHELVGMYSVVDGAAGELARRCIELEAQRDALRVVAEKARQYMDTGRGDLDGALAALDEAYPE